MSDVPYQKPVAAVAGYHGYMRNQGSIVWSLAWATFGYAFPLIAVGVAFYQGFGKPKGS